MCVELKEWHTVGVIAFFLPVFFTAKTVAQNPAAERRFDCMKRQSGRTPVFT